ncbi:hypothetical protein ACFQI7_13845 [Paenibacillus allorhizosphaerae]|nr:hypothetical protein [Paenibacillus allorhizosphaerae]
MNEQQQKQSSYESIKEEQAIEQQNEKDMNNSQSQSQGGCDSQDNDGSC